MTEAMHPVVHIAKAAVESYIRQGKIIKPEENSPEMKERAGVFVSLKKYGHLRGCIGTFEPTQDNVAGEIVANAISSATADPRFAPVSVSELDELDYSVDILTSPEPVKSAKDLDPMKYGVIVESGYRRGLLLPNLEGVNTVDEQISICRSKAGIGTNEPVKLYRFMVRRYK
jgi:AmmeMemoRadiSam system protein A